MGKNENENHWAVQSTLSNSFSAVGLLLMYVCRVFVVALVQQQFSIRQLQRLVPSSTRHRCQTSFTTTTRCQAASTRRYLDCLATTSRTLRTCTEEAAGYRWCRQPGTEFLDALGLPPDSIWRRWHSSRIMSSDLPESLSYRYSLECILFARRRRKNAHDVHVINSKNRQFVTGELFLNWAYTWLRIYDARLVRY